MASIIMYLNEHYAITIPLPITRREGKPFILLHGLLSDGEDLFPLAQELHEKLVNLYGFWIFQVWDVLL